MSDDPRPRRTQEERRADAEHRLLDAAAELITEIGPARITLANIGERAGYSRGLATHHFGSKGAMMQRLVDAVTAQFRAAVFANSQSDSVLDEALGLIDTYFAALAHPAPINRARLMLWADAVVAGSPEVAPTMLAADREFRDELTKLIQRGIASRQFADSVNPDGLATAVVGMLRGIALQHLLDPQVDLGAARAEAERLLINRVNPPQQKEANL
ncbi:MAG: TetR/AcrR family transcriptional regulator [Mycobacterium sp.]|uniref:TetR/AcrR family transcriptional regulator n=1 Tax=Mycobacterium sp. TaxID=1785 RepID=UPI001EC17334|nr:TetR/AcrR family transcriptional regulator [Mycobacterium sp.]MBW0019907.1 TetR/AcrR family transcriptional regulator [Mycobacterium sp.]